jgi:RNA polymerase sigma-70 factor, ECF subfamily
MPALSTTRPGFSEVFAEHLDYVWRVLRHLGIPASDVEDVAQEVFVVVHRRLPEWEPRADIRSWLYAIAWRVARDHRQGAWARRRARGEPDPELAASAAPDEQAAARQALARVQKVLEGLEEEQRMVFVLYEIEGIAMEDIATAMSCPLKTAYSRLRLARERVRASYLAKEVGHGP